MLCVVDWFTVSFLAPRPLIASLSSYQFSHHFDQSVTLRNGKTVPFGLFLTARFFNPLQGVFNILVFSGPFVSSMKRSHPEYSWWKAFCLTVLSGGDNNLSGQSKRTNPGKASQKVRDKIELNNRKKMRSIRGERRTSLFNNSEASSFSFHKGRHRLSYQLSIESSVPRNDDENDERRLVMANDDCVAISTDLESPICQGEARESMSIDRTNADDVNVAGML